MSVPAPTRVLHIMGSSGIGGFETITARVLAGMDKSRFENSIFFMDDKREISPSIEPHCNFLFHSSSNNPFAKILELRKFIKQVKPSVIFAGGFNANMAFRLARLAAPGLRNTKYVFHLRSIHTSMNPNPGKELLDRLSFGPVDLILSNSRNALEGLKLAGYPDKPSIISLNGLDTTLFCPDSSFRLGVRTRLGLPPDALLITCVANIKTVKNHPMLIRAFARLKNPDAFLLLVGKSEDIGPVLEVITNEGLENRVLLLGQRKDISDLLKASDIFALASNFEGISGSIQEAMACGLPVLSTLAGGGVREIIQHQETGWLVETGDEQAFAAGLQVLVEEKNLRLSLGRNARQYAVDNFSIPRMVACWEKAASTEK